MGGKKGVREENRVQCIGRRDREKKEKIGWNKVYGISSFLNIGKHTQSQAAAEIQNLSDYSGLSTTE